MNKIEVPEWMLEMVSCPFCKEEDFDLMGLKFHLQNYCGKYSEIKFGREAIFRDANRSA